jgi:nucleotide-binding universal stress UspA family protein
MSAISLIQDQIKEQKPVVGFKHVLIATDFSPCSERALAHALPIVRRYGSKVSIVHAILPESREPLTFDPLPRVLDRGRAKAETKMGRLAHEARITDLNPHMLLERGSVWQVLSSVIPDEKTDLLVLGTRGRGGLKKLALGSVAEEVLHRAACPVLTIGPDVPPAEVGKAEFKTILFATDFGPASTKAFPYALFLAEDCQAQLILLHIVPPTLVADVGPGVYGPGIYLAQELIEWQEAKRKESLRGLKELVPLHANLRYEPEYLVGLDPLPDGILEAAASRNVDLIVMGANPVAAARVAAHIPWALTHDVICKAQCPVLTVRR